MGDVVICQLEPEARGTPPRRAILCLLDIGTGVGGSGGSDGSSSGGPGGGEVSGCVSYGVGR